MLCKRIIFLEKNETNVEQIDMHHFTLEMKDLQFINKLSINSESLSSWEGTFIQITPLQSTEVKVLQEM